MVRKYESIDQLSPAVRAGLSKFVTNVGGDTFVIYGLPSELTGAALARYSRAPTGLQLTLANEFLDDDGNPVAAKGTAMLERVLIGFGDDSVGELEGVHVGLEDVSQLLTKEVEDRRIGGSPIEQSTRYVKYDQRDSRGRWRYLRPQEIKEAGLMAQFEGANNRAFEVYSEGVRRLIEYFKDKYPQTAHKIEVDREKNGNRVKIGESELQSDNERREFNNSYNFTIRSAALDVGRCVLPSSTLTHIGLYANGRFFTNLLTHLKSSPLIEANERALKLEAELMKTIPTFIKRNKINPKVSQTNNKMVGLADDLFRGIVPESQRVTLTGDSNYLDQLLSSAVFPYTNISLPQIEGVVSHLPHEKKLEILDAYVGERESRRDRTGRGLEAGYPLLFDLVGGFAEYRDLERHRMLTQQRQLITPDLGFVIPPEMGEIGLEKEVLEVVEQFEDLNSNMRDVGLREASQYATLFNHRMRFMLGMNLREFQHLSELRTQPAGHFSYRSMVMEMSKVITDRYNWAERVLGFIDYSDKDNKITRAKEQSRIAGKNLSEGLDGGVDLQ